MHRDLIVIGASAGGIETLQNLLRRLPPTCPRPFLWFLYTRPWRIRVPSWGWLVLSRVERPRLLLRPEVCRRTRRAVQDARRSPVAAFPSPETFTTMSTEVPSSSIPVRTTAMPRLRRCPLGIGRERLPPVPLPTKRLAERSTGLGHIESAEQYRDRANNTEQNARVLREFLVHVHEGVDAAAD